MINYYEYPFCCLLMILKRVYVGVLYLFCFFTLFYKDYGALHLT